MVMKTPIKKCVILCAALFAAVMATSSVQAADLDPLKTQDGLTISRKIMCSTVDGEPATYWWFGKAYSRKQGERDVHLFDVEGMNVRACVGTKDGFNLVSRELLLYKDKNTGEVLKTWENPWTGEEVEVLHVANDPVNGKFRTKARDGSDYKWTGVVSGDVWWWTATVPLYYPNVLGGDYQKEVGPSYHATEMFNFFGDKASLLDPATTSAEGVEVGWARMSDWLPWMNMSGREGIIYMHTAGRKLGNWDELSDTLKAEIKKHYPDYKNPPPLDDERKNMTSWRYFDEVRKGNVDAPIR